MPLPKPNSDETKDEFISRCMSNATMKADFSDNDQRLAVCFQRWKDKEKKSAEPFETSPFERRYTSATELRVKDTEKNAITGYAAVFDSWSEDLGFFKERIASGTFTKTIKDGDVRALINHDPNLIIGRTKNETLRLWEDERGLGFDVDLPNTSYANDLRESIARKDITQNSFGFQTVKDEWSEDGKKRTLLEVKLFDISPVTFPAYKQTHVKLRLQEIGIDYELLGAALIRSARGAAIEEDVEFLRSTIKILSMYVPDLSDPSIVGRSDPGQSAEDDPPIEIADPGQSKPGEPELVSTLIRARTVLMQSEKHLKRRIF